MVLVVVSGGCSFDVTNPGPLQDSALDNPAAHTAMVNGAAREFSEGLSWLNFVGAAVARELFPSGSTAQLGISVRQQHGELDADEVNDHWAAGQRARWMAEYLLRRMEESTDVSDYAPAANLALFAGYANRLLGENFCSAVIDGGAAQAHTVHFERAETYFDRAEAIATAAGESEIATAARAGRASVRALLGDWAGAVTDASSITDPGFSFAAEHFRVGCCTGNRISLAQSYNGNDPHRSLTVWNTPYLDYYTQTGDPRTPWAPDPLYATGSGARDGIGAVPYYVQLKYAVSGSQRGQTPTPLSHYAEMQMILAEAELRQGDWQAAMTIINDVRTSYTSDSTGQPLDPWPAASLDEAWTALKRERGIVTWLEGRRLGDLRRWDAEGTPGSLDPLEEVPGRDLCIPPSRAEVNTNPNID